MAARYFKCLVISTDRYSLYWIRLEFHSPLKCHREPGFARSHNLYYVYGNYTIENCRDSDTPFVLCSGEVKRYCQFLAQSELTTQRLGRGNTTTQGKITGDCRYLQWL